MNDFERLLQDAWSRVQLREGPALAARVRRHRWRQRLLRAVQGGLTLVAVVVLAGPLYAGDATPAAWLLAPFFAVYLPSAWVLLLRSPRPRAIDAACDARAYAQLRMSQLRAGLRDLWRARAVAWALLAYAACAVLAAAALGGAGWLAAALRLLAYAAAWAAATWWWSRRRRTSLLREYRAMRAAAGPGARG